MDVRVFLSLYAFRIYNALLIKTYFNPDEFWQSLEVAHEFVFGYGHLTWEWALKIRSSAYPLLIALSYKILQALEIDTAQAVVVVPKVLQAVFAACTDYFTYLLAFKSFGAGPAKWTLLASLMHHFNFFCSVRTFGNSVETAFTTAALAYWPNAVGTSGVKFGEYRIALVCAAIACVLRPTGIILWAWLGGLLLVRHRANAILLILNAVIIGLLAIAASLAIDAVFYGELIFVPYNFMKFNVLQGVASFYGVHPWHWYISQGIPLVGFTFIPFIIHGYFYGADSRGIKSMTVVTLLSFSLLPHKEFRFIFPLLPPNLIFAGLSLHRIQIFSSSITVGKGVSRNKGGGGLEAGIPRMSLLRAAIIFLATTNGLAAWYLGCVHQRGVMDVMAWFRAQLAKKDGSVTGILFLMPCHSTPLYSHLHRNIPTRFLSCEPPFQSNIPPAEYMDEADLFYQNPIAFLNAYSDIESLDSVSSANTELIQIEGQGYNIRRIVWPSHVVHFEQLLPQIENYLSRGGYKECARIFNSHVIDDSRRQGPVIVHCR